MYLFSTPTATKALWSSSAASWSCFPALPLPDAQWRLPAQQQPLTPCTAAFSPVIPRGCCCVLLRVRRVNRGQRKRFFVSERKPIPKVQRHRREFASIPNVWVTWHDAGHVTKSPRLSLRFSFGRVKGHTWNYCAEGGRAWERGYVYICIHVINFQKNK